MKHMQLRYHYFSHYSAKIHHHRRVSEQRPILKMTASRWFKTSILWPQSGNADAGLRFLHQSVYQSPCSAFRHLWIPPQDTSTSLPAAVPLTCSVHWLGFLGRHNTPVF